MQKKGFWADTLMSEAGVGRRVWVRRWRRAPPLLRTVAHAEVVQLANWRHAREDRARSEPEVLWKALLRGEHRALTRRKIGTALGPVDTWEHRGGGGRRGRMGEVVLFLRQVRSFTSSFDQHREGPHEFRNRTRCFRAFRDIRIHFAARTLPKLIETRIDGDRRVRQIHRRPSQMCVLGYHRIGQPTR